MGKTLQQIIDEERLDPDGPEMSAIIASRNDIEALLRRSFGYSGISIRYGGSKAKGTILSCEHDLDLLVYFHRDNTAAGDTIADIYRSVGDALAQDYFVQAGTTSLRVYAGNGPARRDLKVDVVPGRFIEGSSGDVFLHQNDAQKSYLMTNPETHIRHVAESGVVPALCGLKLWRIKNGVGVKQFPFELLCLDLLKPLKRKLLDEQVQSVLGQLAAMRSAPRIADPANTNNDVSGMLANAWLDIQQAASDALRRTSYGWADVLGVPEAVAGEKLYAMAAAVHTPTKPWSN